MPREFTVSFSYREKKPFVFKQVEYSSQVQERRQYVDHIVADPSQLPVEPARIVNMFNGVRTQHPFKLSVIVGKPVDVGEPVESRDINMPYYICIYAPTVRVPAAQV